MGGLGCIGKPITNFIGLMAALRREIIRGGTMANPMTGEARRIVGILEEATLREDGMTLLAHIPAPLLFASGQFRQGKLQIYINGDCSKGDGMEVRVSPPSFSYSFLFYLRRRSIGPVEHQLDIY